MNVFNGERFLREAIESILGQRFPDFEFIAIDDGSTDETAAILDAYAQKDSRLQVYQQENRGMSAANNRGCALARGKYIAHLDADDVAMPDRLERQIAFLENHEKVGLLGGAIEEIDHEGNPLLLRQLPLEDVSIRAAMQTLTPALFHPAVVMRKQAFDATGGYRAQFLHAEDFDLFLCIMDRWKVANLPEVVTRRRIHAQQISVRYVRQQLFSVLGARALAAARQRHEVEPPFPGPVISEGFLDQLGVSRDLRHRLLVGTYYYLIESMLQNSQDDAVVGLVDELYNLSGSGPVGRSALSNALLLAARIRYRQGQPFRASGSVARAVLTRPMVVGRPLKRAMTYLFRKSQPEIARP
jgi:hypothetical protein